MGVGTGGQAGGGMLLWYREDMVDVRDGTEAGVN